MTIFRALKRNGITRKKKTYHAVRRDHPDVQQNRQAFQEKLATVDQNHLVFVDETGTTTAMGRTNGRALEGERVYASAPGAWKNVTLISGLRRSGVVAPFALPGATDRTAFEVYVKKVLLPELQVGDVEAWDNLSAHDSAAAIAAIQAVGASVEPLPVYSPDLTPIEEMFSKVKAGLRTIAARSIDAVIDGMGKVLDKVTPKNILGWFRDRCPYAKQS